jgi:hypothetical protein
MNRRAAIAVVSALVVGCAPPPRPATAPRTHAGADELIPGGLDLVIRIDVARLRRALGDAALGRATAFASGPIGRAIGGASTVFLGFRGPPDGGRSDVVIAAAGSFASLDPAAEEPSLWRETERSPSARRFVATSPAERAAPAFLYVEGGRLLVAASSAEIDALERHLTLAVRSSALEPPADGVVGLAARVRAFPEPTLRAHPELSAALAGVTVLRGSLDADGGFVRFDVIAAFRSEAEASRGEQTLRRVVDTFVQAGGAAAAVAKVVTVDRPAPTSLVVRVRLSANELAALTAPATSP